MKWYQKPLATVGAVSVTYHEVFRNRRTGICQRCGRLNHATSDRCLCGGTVAENDHPEDVLDDYEPPENEVIWMALVATVLLGIPGWVFVADGYVVLFELYPADVLYQHAFGDMPPAAEMSQFEKAYYGITALFHTLLALVYGLTVVLIPAIFGLVGGLLALVLVQDLLRAVRVTTIYAVRQQSESILTDEEAAE